MSSSASHLLLATLLRGPPESLSSLAVPPVFRDSSLTSVSSAPARTTTQHAGGARDHRGGATGDAAEFRFAHAVHLTQARISALHKEQRTTFGAAAAASSSSLMSDDLSTDDDPFRGGRSFPVSLWLSAPAPLASSLSSCGRWTRVAKRTGITTPLPLPLVLRGPIPSLPPLLAGCA